jgi:hypothetical protein
MSFAFINTTVTRHIGRLRNSCQRAIPSSQPHLGPFSREQSNTLIRAAMPPAAGGNARGKAREVAFSEPTNDRLDILSSLGRLSSARLIRAEERCRAAQRRKEGCLLQ